MLCLHLQRRPSPSFMNSFLQPLWPASRDVFSDLEQEMIRTVEKIKSSFDLMEQFHQKLLQEVTVQQNKTLPVLNGSDAKATDKGFTLCLGVEDFSPEELTVKLLGRKLLVTGAKESKCNDGKGSFSYKCQIFRKEADLPMNVREDKLSCTMTAEGKLLIEAPEGLSPAEEGRNVPIQLTGSPAITQATEGSSEGIKEPETPNPKLMDK
ncbi:hypothetical protein XENTR_v10003541 [Xenopus tropicalis]|uniref:Heat shock protein beta-11 n=1 Tax=Xenopus tropicalis TaxID=8364 RepID=A0A6I8QKA7_XENTR|nr:heat shock protein beta-11 [Xenopus tropicalis]KAE8574701.1 hypothetical protein XENTR_v10003541 [Xenopus tropicalis]|eukprot:XP_002939080.1 PREDICTED: heat shock protein beta-11-like [Xenopus tropicalis]